MKKTLLTGIVSSCIPLISFANEYTNYKDCTKNNGTYFCNRYFDAKEKTENNTQQIQNNYPAQLNTTKKSNIQGFIGANASISSITWSDDLKIGLSPIELAEVNAGLGIEGGVRFGQYESIYNPGLTINYDYLIDSPAEIPSPYSSIYSEIATGFSAVALSFDNYLRVNSSEGKRSDFVFGIGYGNATERAKTTTTYYGKQNGFYNTSESDDGSAIVLKVGLNSEISDKLDWNIGIRTFIPTDSDADVESITMGYLGFRRKF